MSETSRLQRWHQILRNKLLQINLFDSRSSDAIKIRHEILSTRLFLLLFLISLLSLAAYTSLSVQIQRESVQLPTEATYRTLEAKYATTLQCPCKKIAVPYETFVQVQPSFHQVCSSVFVSQTWIDFTFQTNLTNIWPMDVRAQMSALWKVVAALCQSATNTFADTLSDFDQSSLISSMVFSEELLRAKTQATLNLAQQTASSALVRPLTLINSVSLANVFITAMSSNYRPIFFPGPLGPSVAVTECRYTMRGSGATCMCFYNRSCPITGGLYLHPMQDEFNVYNLNQLIPNKTVPGIVLDCTPLQTVYASTFECFFNRSCLNVLLTAFSNSINISILNESSPSRFLPTTPIEQLATELFIEEIFNQTNYSSYYLQCAPTYCSYTYTRQFYWLYVGTTLLALFGGLNVGLHILAPYVIDLILALKRKRAPQAEDQETPRRRMGDRLLDLMRTVKILLVNLNVFDKHSRDPLKIHRGRIATRLYIALLVAVIGILAIYTSTSMQSISGRVGAPTLEHYEQLQEQYSTTIRCPCNSVSIPNEELIQLMPVYHQLCGSDFIQPWWYSSLFVSFSDYVPGNFMNYASTYFRTLAMFCDIANVTVVNAMKQFNSTMYVNAQAIPRALFISEASAIIDTFLNMTQAEFMNSFSLINEILHANQYMSGILTNGAPQIINISSYAAFTQQSWRVIWGTQIGKNDKNEQCSCARDPACNVGNLAGSSWKTVPGVSLRCLILDTALKSSLLCWYNQTCLVGFLAGYANKVSIATRNITALNDQASSRFPPSTLVETLVNEMMIEKWNSSVSYTSFYQNCKPAFCTFTYQERSSVVFIITALISLFGGLSIVLRWISLIMMSIVIRHTGTNASDESSTTRENPVRHDSWMRLRERLVSFNIFDDGSAGLETVHHERFSTRLYVCLLCSSILALTVSTLLSIETTDRRLTQPTQVQYEDLLASHSDTLQCPCTNISIARQRFTTITTTFHQACSSSFVNESWISYLFGNSKSGYQERADLRVRGAAYFDFLRTLCQLSQTTIQNAIDDYLHEAYVNVQAISPLEFNSQMNASTSQFEKNTPAMLLRVLQLAHAITDGNTFISSYFLNWYWQVNSVQGYYTVPTVAVTFSDGCSCGKQRSCSESGGIYTSFSRMRNFTMPGFNISCSVVETLLQSTFECLYNQACIDQLSYYATTVPTVLVNRTNVTAMNSTWASRFQTTTTIGDILNLLFVENWQINYSYSLFYQQCTPNYCAYTVGEKNSFLYIFSRILGLYGGLTVIITFIVPYMTIVAFKMMGRFNRNPVAPVA